MIMPIVNRVRALASTTFNAAGLHAVNYQLLKTLEDPAFYIRIVNLSKLPIDISYDTAANPNKVRHDYLMADESLAINFQANNQLPGKIANMARGTSIYIRGTPGAGSIVFTGYTSQP